MAGKASINIKFAADLKQFSSQMQNANRSIAKMGKKLQNVGANLSVGVTAPFAAFSAIALKNFDTQDKAIAQVNQGLKSTGRFTDELSKKLQDQAVVLQNNSLFGDEDILQNSTAQILSFTNISVDKIGRVNQVVADLSTRLKVDLKSSAIQLSKALNDPIANLSALSRSGIQFSVDQKAMIKSLVETNKLAEAQNIILAELEAQYGGSAKAAADAGTGWLKQISNSIGDLTEDFGVHINTALKPLGENIKNIVKAIQNWSPETKKMALIIGGLSAALGPLLIALGFLMTTVVPGLITSFGYLRASILVLQTGFLKLTAIIAANPFGALAVALAAVASYFLIFNRETDKTIKKQSILTDVNNEAAKSIAGEKAKLEELLFIARNENIQKSARIKAIKDLNKLSPEFLGNLTLEKINTDEARKAVELYNLELIKTAKTKAAQGKLQELQSKIIDLELAKEKNSVSIAKEKLAIGKETGLTAADKNKLLNVTNKNQELGNILQSKELQTLKDQETQLLKIIAANQTLNKVVSEKEPTVTGRKKATAVGLEIVGVKDLNLSSPLEKEAEKLDGTLGSIKSKFIDFSMQTSEIVSAMAVNVIAGFGEMIGGLISGNLTMGDVAGSLMQTIGGLATQLGKAAIEIGIGMLAIKAAFKNPFTAIAAGVALVALGTVISSAANITSGDGSNNFAGSFAEGGVVGGNSFTGDKLFARINSGEMVLNKRQQGNLMGMINPAQQNIKLEVVGGAKITDRELLYFIDKSRTKISRTS